MAPGRVSCRRSPAQQQHVAAWLAEELPLLLPEQPWQQATVTVAGASELDHDAASEVVVASSSG